MKRDKDRKPKQKSANEPKLEPKPQNTDNTVNDTPINSQGGEPHKQISPQKNSPPKEDEDSENLRASSFKKKELSPNHLQRNNRSVFVNEHENNESSPTYDFIEPDLELMDPKFFKENQVKKSNYSQQSGVRVNVKELKSSQKESDNMEV